MSTETGSQASLAKIRELVMEKNEIQSELNQEKLRSKALSGKIVLLEATVKKLESEKLGSVAMIEQKAKEIKNLTAKVSELEMKIKEMKGEEGDGDPNTDPNPGDGSDSEGKFTAGDFEARIAELKEQIIAALPTLESNERLSGLKELTKAMWDCKKEWDDAKVQFKQAKTKEEKQKWKKIEQEKKEEWKELRKTNLPLQMNEAEAFFREIEPTLKELENAIMECSILIRSEPERLAQWCAEKGAHRDMWKEFMENKDLQKKMIVNGGASLGKFHKSLEIHTGITRDIGDDAPNEVYDKIALAVALELADPVEIFHQKNVFVDPLERFWHYANAHTNNHLDKVFAGLTVWEMRNVVNSNATNEDSTWLREFLKKYRPDQARTPCSIWRYLWQIRTDMLYRPPVHEFDDFKDVLSAGGKCGPVSFYSRALIRAWGRPVWGVSQPGHAAIGRWHPEGLWTTANGLSWWNSNYIEKRYYRAGGHRRAGTDFDEDGRGRFNSTEEQYFYNVALIEAVADINEEWLKRFTPPEQIWRSVALSRRLRFAKSPWRKEPEEWKSEPLKLGRPLLPDTPEKFSTDEKIEFKGGQWVVPPTLCSDPKLSEVATVFHEFKDTEFPYYPSPDYYWNHVLVMRQWTGEWCIHVGKDASMSKWVTYTMPDDFAEGSYDLSLKVVTVHKLNQFPLIFVIVDPEGNESEEIVLDMPYTRGEWKNTESIKVEMKPGSKFKFRMSVKWNCKVTIKEFQLKPVEA